MKYLIFLLIPILNSCEISSNESKSKVKQVQFFETIDERNYTNVELAIGKRVCSSLKMKRRNFEGLSNNTHQLLKESKFKKCDENIFSNPRQFKVVLDNSNSTDMSYFTSAVEGYFKNVITDKSYNMNLICDKILNDEKKVSNTVREELTATTFHFTVSEANRFDRLEISKKFIEQARLVTKKVEAIDFYTKLNQTKEQFMGLEVFRETFTFCPGDKVDRYQEQTTRALTEFK
jgi:hypothetical protein